MTDVWIYARVSQDKRDRRSVNQQVEECQDWCDAEGWNVANVVIDNDISASRFAKSQRENWPKITEAIRQHRMNMLMMWETSRATRKLDGFAELRNLCEQHQVKLAYSGDVYDMSKPNDRRRAATDSINAEYESEMTSARVKRDRRKMARNGLPAGRVPYGYRIIHDSVTGERQRVPDPVTAPLVQEAASRFLNGESLFSIAKDWNVRSIPTPYQPKPESRATKMTTGQHGWQQGFISRILKNPAINNRYVHKGEIIGAGTWEAIIDDVTWERLVSKFSDPTRATFRATTEPKLLTGGILRCGTCGGPLVYMPKRGTGARTVKLYRCKYGKSSDGRSHVSRNMDQLDAYITGIILERAQRGELTIADDATNVDEVRSQMAEVDATIDDLASRFLAGKITADMLERLEPELRERKRQLEQSIRVVNVPANLQAFTEAHDPVDYWNGLEVEERRALIKASLLVIVHPVATVGSKRFDTSTIEVRKA